MKKITIREITRIGIMAAAVYVASAFLQVPIPTAIDNTRLHMGNVMCLLSGMLLGPLQGGLAAGIGSMFFDLTNPAYIASAPFTFIFKFVMAWICGKITSGSPAHRKQRYVVGGIAGAFAYVVLYLSKSFIEHRFVLGLPLEAVMLTVTQKAVVSSVNAIVACVVAVPLGLAPAPCDGEDDKIIMEMDMTKGKPVKALLKFSVPLFAGNIMQNLYNVFDTAVVGHVLGKDALAAVGNSYVPMLIINSIILGLSSGILILLAQVYGSGEKVQGCMGSIRTLVFLTGGGLACIFFLSAGWVFRAMGIPAAAARPAAEYLRITALGIPFLSAYNFYSAVAKAGGDARTPVRDMSVSCLMNIVLDYVFVVILRLGIRGAASATVISQAAAAGLAVFHLCRKDKKALAVRPDFKYVLPVFRLGVTSIVQNGASAVSMFFIQGVINRFGINEISAYAAAYRIETILTIPAVNLGASLSVFTAQNAGAKNFDRCCKGLRDGFKISVVFVAAVVAVIWVASPQFMYLLVGDEKEVVRIGVRYLHIVSLTFPFCVSLYLLTNFLRGAGEFAYPVFNTMLELGFRTAFAFVSVRYIGFYGIMLCRPLSFLISTASLSCRYFTKKMAGTVRDKTF